MRLFKHDKQVVQKRVNKLHRQKIHRRKCQLLFAESKALSVVKGSSNREYPNPVPYSSDFVVNFCKKHWATWTDETYAELLQSQHDAIHRPSRALSNTIYNLEYLWFRLSKVRSMR